MAAKLKIFTPFKASGARELLERASNTRNGKIYKGVTIIKSGLGNLKDKHFYPPDALKEAVNEGMFEGLRAFADHPDSVSEEILPERSIRDIVGIYTNTRFKESKDEGCVVGDLRILKSAGWLADMVDELIGMGQADKIGISINGRGQTTPRSIKMNEAGDELDVNYCDKFIALRSGDIVTEAGAGGGFQQLLESARGSGTVMKTDKKALIAALQEAVAQDDKEKIKEITAKLGEASKKGDKKDEEDDEEDEKDGEDDEDEEDDEEEKGKKKKGMKESSEKKKDPDAELEAAHKEILDEADGALKETEEEDDEDEEEEDDDFSESEEDEQENRLIETMTPKQLKRFGRKIAEATKKLPGDEGRGESGNQTVNAKKKQKAQHPFAQGPNPTTYTGKNKVRESGSNAELLAELEALKARNAKLLERNTKLVANLTTRTSADRARKMLRESKIPVGLRSNILPLLVGKSESDMRRAINYHVSLIEGIMGRSLGDAGEDFDPIEGAGASIRESNSGIGDESASGILAEVGLPLKKK